MTTFNNTTPNTTANSSLATAFCGFPAFCDISGSVACATVPLKSCKACTMAGASIFMVFCLLLGLLIVAGNLLVIVVTMKTGVSKPFAKLKISLALADMFTGFQLLIVATYNFVWTINVTSVELDRRQLLLQGSAESTVGGIFLLLTFTSSLYHLVFMGVQRLYAIKWPLLYKNQGLTPTYAGLTLVWGMSVFISSLPAWFPNTMAYSYHPSVFLFYISMKNASNMPLVLTLVILGIAIPYVLMSCVTVMTLVFVRTHTSRSSKNIGPSSIDKNELKIFKTVGIMQIGFTTALLPVVTINAMYFGGVVHCNTISVPFLVCFYIGMINSLINVVIYSVREKKFRMTLKGLFSPSTPGLQTKASVYQDRATSSSK